MNADKMYLELLSKVDMFSVRVVTACPGSMACGPGCDHCCRNTFSIFAVEAANLGRGFETLPEDVKTRIRDASAHAVTAGSPCPLLHEGLCSLYEYRPVICRTHGLPLVSEHIVVGGRKVTTLCERNFKELAEPADLPREYVLDLDRLNTALSAINMLFIKEHPDTIERVSLGRLFV